MNRGPKSLLNVQHAAIGRHRTLAEPGILRDE
jgi:hypothetical protein